ncbi:MAG: SpoIIE family protein phosphatase [Planctomycetota bacterium]
MPFTSLGAAPKFELVAIDDPYLAPLRIVPGRTFVMGRATDADMCINEASVSRRHASVRVEGRSVLLEDLASKHGTKVNEQPLRPGRPVALSDGDIIRLGPARLKVVVPRERISTDMMGGAVESVQTYALRSDSGMEPALRGLLDTVRGLPAGIDEAEAGAILLARILSESRLERGLIVRRVGGSEDVEIVATAGARGGAVSRTLLAAAEDVGKIAHLSGSEGLRFAESVASSGVLEALCARIEAEGESSLFLYLDSRRLSSPVGPTVVEYAGFAARIAGLVFERFARQRLEALRRDVERAQSVQQRLLPAAIGTGGGIAWRLHSQPGSHLAGDFAGVAPRGDGGSLVWIGDVCGKGAAAAMLMAAAHGWLRASAKRGDSPAEIADALNRFLCEHSESHEFLTLFIAVIGTDGMVTACDAGQSRVFRVGAGRAEFLRDLAGGGPIGMAEDSEYQQSTFRLGGDERLVLFTDGVDEQPHPEDERMRFGFERVESILAASRGSGDDLSATVEALEAFAGRASFEDDVTILSIARS